MSPLAEGVATEVRVLMARRRLNQSDVAALVGHDQTWVSKRLSGRTAITLDDLDALAEAFEVKPGELLPQNRKYMSNALGLSELLPPKYTDGIRCAA